LRRVPITFALILSAGLAAAGCSSSPLLDSDTYSQLFHKKIDVFATPDWARPNVTGNNMQLSPKGPVAAEDLVAADGRCAPKVAAAPPAAPPAPEPQAAAAQPQPAAPAEPAPTLATSRVGTVAGDLAGPPMPAGPPPKPIPVTTGSAPPPDRLQPEGGLGVMPSGPALLGGIGLGMTECQVVRRAGTPSNLSIGSDKKGDRMVVLSYLEGNWPGIYHFQSGRLKEVDAAPGQVQPAEKTKTKAKRKARKKPAPQKSASHEFGRGYVQ
jgi:hypothetical protein